MPTYAYTCTACGHAFDIHQSFSDEALTVCPECSGKLRKVFSPVGVVFKGSGFYRNDARSSSKTKVGASSGPSASSPTTPSPSGSSTPPSAPSGSTSTASSTSTSTSASSGSAKAASA